MGIMLIMFQISIIILFRISLNMKSVHYAQFVTVSAKTVLIGTFSITRKTDLKYSSQCGSAVLDFSHARFTV